jgi:hypothetical protein
MPAINEVKDTCLELMRNHSRITPLLLGAPGSGKSDVAIQIGRELGYSDDRILVVHINNYDVVDFTGVPSVKDGYTVFNPTKFFYDFREGTGGGLIIFEELPQSPHGHQTFVAGFELERQTESYKLDPEVRMICTGNRAEDKAGAKQMLSHLNDRLWFFDVETSVEAWCTWALKHGVNPIGIAFLRLRRELLNAFDPNNRSSPTQRSWTKVFTQIPDGMSQASYLMACTAKVGEGAAAEWVAARDMMSKMPNIDAIRLKPDTTEVPKEPSVQFAVSTSLSTTTTVDTFAKDLVYIDRMPKEFAMLYLSDVMTTHPELQQTPTFKVWSQKNADIFLGAH